MDDVDIRRHDRRLSQLRGEISRAKGTQSRLFYCPILMVDEKASLCKGHVVPEAAGGRDWVPQRKDVDNFFGGFAEGDYMHGISLRELDATSSSDDVLEYLQRHHLSSKVGLALGRDKSWIPARIAGRAKGNGRYVLATQENSNMIDQSFPAGIRLDTNMMLPTIVACLHTAHLGIFNRAGYRYVTDKAGWFIGSMLGGLYRRYSGKANKRDRKLVKAQPRALPQQLLPYRNMVRPLPKAAELIDPRLLQEPFDWFHVAWDRESVFATIHYLRVGSECHAVMVYTAFDERTFAHACSEQPLSFEVRLGHYTKRKIEYSHTGQRVIWPCGDQRRPPVSLARAAKHVLRNGLLRAS